MTVKLITCLIFILTARVDRADSQACSLCPGGSEVGNARREDKGVTMANCGGNQYLSSLFTAEECSPEFDVDLAAFCLCPDFPPPELMCELCSGSEVENPEFLYDE
jgi:hypothetical protein